MNDVHAQAGAARAAARRGHVNVDAGLVQLQCAAATAAAGQLMALHLCPLTVLVPGPVRADGGASTCDADSDGGEESCWDDAGQPVVSYIDRVLKRALRELVRSAPRTRGPQLHGADDAGAAEALERAMEAIKLYARKLSVAAALKHVEVAEEAQAVVAERVHHLSLPPLGLYSTAETVHLRVCEGSPFFGAWTAAGSRTAEVCVADSPLFSCTLDELQPHGSRALQSTLPDAPPVASWPGPWPPRPRHFFAEALTLLHSRNRADGQSRRRRFVVLDTTLTSCAIDEPGMERCGGDAAAFLASGGLGRSVVTANYVCLTRDECEETLAGAPQTAEAAVSAAFDRLRGDEHGTADGIDLAHMAMAGMEDDDGAGAAMAAFASPTVAREHDAFLSELRSVTGAGASKRGIVLDQLRQLDAQGTNVDVGGAVHAAFRRAAEQVGNDWTANSADARWVAVLDALGFGVVPGACFVARAAAAGQGPGRAVPVAALIASFTSHEEFDNFPSSFNA